jgi:tetratricopeptide (TPR) repeat protein
MRVAVRGRVLVLPFAGKDDRRIELTDLYVRRLKQMEQEWVQLAKQIQDTREEVNGRAQRNRSANALNASSVKAPLISGAALPPSSPTHGDVAVAGSALRTSGDELLDDVVQLAKVGAIGDADLGVVSLAGVSFSPRDVLALLRAAPGVFARRILRGSILAAGGLTLFSVEYEERGILGHRRRTTQISEVRDDQWVPAVEELAFRLAKERVYLVRKRKRRKTSQPSRIARPKTRRDDPSQPQDVVDAAQTSTARALSAPRHLVDRPHGANSKYRTGRRRRGIHGSRASSDLMSARSETVKQAIIEATSWEACRAFLIGYAAHLEHYSHGRAADREDALAHYDSALESQPGFPRAAYNRATLLYNRYLPEANDQAIDDFQLATGSADPSLRPLAFAGVAMAHCQAMQRFERTAAEHKKKARDAAAMAVQLAPDLEEALFANGWIHQMDGKWMEAVRTYEAVLRLPGTSAPALRVKSFALNNAAWIWLNKLDREADALTKAERQLWRALELYPNKVAYANLAEIARRLNRRNDSIKLFRAALALTIHTRTL